MIRLISKVQYKNFEIGEFIKVQERSYDETIQLIENFPWNHQRQGIVIDLTNPSITIEGKHNDFLKVALFFNQKYVLHYFNEAEDLYTKSFINLYDGYEYIKLFFVQPEFDTGHFKKENTWLQKNLKHFVTNDFKYVLTPKLAKNYLLSTSGMNFCISIIFLFLLITKGSGSMKIGALIVLLPTMFLFGGGLHLILFFNYYNYVRNKILIMSKGNDNFYFGNIRNPDKYNKKDILQYRTIRSRGSRNPLNGFAIVEIEFKNGILVSIPNLLIDYASVEHKLFEYQRIDVDQFPFLRK